MTNKIDFFKDSPDILFEEVEFKKKVKKDPIPPINVDDNMFVNNSKKRSRGRGKCFNCKKKKQEGECEYKCPCLKYQRLFFCVDCRFPWAHQCSYDFWKKGNEKLEIELSFCD